MVQKSGSKKSKVIVDIGNGKHIDISHWFNPPVLTDTCEHDETSKCIQCSPRIFNPTREDSVAYSTYMLSKKLQEAKTDYYKYGTSKLTDEQASVEAEKQLATLKSMQAVKKALFNTGLDS